MDIEQPPSGHCSTQTFITGHLKRSRFIDRVNDNALIDIGHRTRRNALASPGQIKFDIFFRKLSKTQKLVLIWVSAQRPALKIESWNSIIWLYYTPSTFYCLSITQNHLKILCSVLDLLLLFHPPVYSCISFYSLVIQNSIWSYSWVEIIPRLLNPDTANSEKRMCQEFLCLHPMQTPPFIHTKLITLECAHW